jgi:uncharacterized protein with PQ loop repeat
VVELIGWASSLILLLTLIRQVYTQWRTGAVAGVSRWLFVGQLAASSGYVFYSWLLHNWVYVSSNVAILVTALTGEAIYLRNRRHCARGAGDRVTGASLG